MYCLPFFLCETLPAEMCGKTMINLCVDANSYKQGKPREIHVKRVHNICISHQFPQEGKSLMPVVHYGHKGFSYLRKLMGNESVEDTFLAYFPQLSLFVRMILYTEFFTLFSSISSRHISQRKKGRWYKDFPSDTKAFPRLSLDFPLTVRESLCIACLSSFRRCDRQKCMENSA